MITIFSASNYYEIGSNKGAYLKFNPQLDTHFVQYTAAASKTRKLTFRQRVGLVESSALRELGARLRARITELEKEFKERDPKGTGTLKNSYTIMMFAHNLFNSFNLSHLGTISVTKWCEAMEAATNLGLPWRLLREKLAPFDSNSPSTDIRYDRTLEMLNTDMIVCIQMHKMIVIMCEYSK